MPIKLMPQEIVNKYKLVDLAVNGNVFIEIRKGMPGLKQAGKSPTTGSPSTSPNTATTRSPARRRYGNMKQIALPSPL